jgi:hypothetical protein
MAIKAKKRGAKETVKNKKDPSNRLGIMGLICAAVGLIAFPLVFGIAAILCGYFNHQRETRNLWKIDIPLGALNTLFGIMLWVGAV